MVGGPSAAESPFLRRPDLLASLVTYWQHHPSLSYLFSSLFIGPTSQAPRIDEARHDQLYELEVALRQVPLPGEGPPPPPWLVDRLFRNLLIDVTGNTHRSEICIDKLYDPASPTGRLGLVEFRAFEMPPHARMSLAQQLLLRAGRLVLGTALPAPPGALGHRAARPLHAAASRPAGLRAGARGPGRSRLPLGPGLVPAAVRVPLPALYGHVRVRDVEIELRAALEPWHVLGEEAVAGGTARYVDSSVERLQVEVRGLEGERFLVCCNRRALPLQETAIRGVEVAGVRFRAWQPPFCLHPTIPVHSPLTIELVDRWNRRSLGGCTYHVMHPAGRNYESLPVNELEAEGRRLARFERLGHSMGEIDPPAPVIDPEFPHTLDLRR